MLANISSLISIKRVEDHEIWNRPIINQQCCGFFEWIYSAIALRVMNPDSQQLAVKPRVKPCSDFTRTRLSSAEAVESSSNDLITC